MVSGVGDDNLCGEHWGDGGNPGVFHRGLLGGGAHGGGVGVCAEVRGADFHDSGRVLGGAALVLYGLIGMLGVRIWQDNKVNFNNPVNLIAAAVALVAGIGNLTLVVFGIHLEGIAWGSVGIIAGYPCSGGFTPPWVRGKPHDSRGGGARW